MLVRSCSVFIAVCSLFASSARGQATLVPHDRGPYAVGEVTYAPFVFQADWSVYTQCDTYTVDTWSRVTWGDGQVSTWSTHCECYEMHRYAIGGSYHVRMQVGWHLGTDYWIGGPPCPDTTGTLAAETTVEVLPYPPAMEDGWLGTAYDVDATVCSRPGPVSRVYLVAGLAGRSSLGIAGAEFRLVRPGGFAATATAMPGWILIGDPFGSGATMASPCAAGAGSNRVPLLEIVTYPLSGATDGRIGVERHLAPTNPTYTGIMLVLCDDPVFTPLAVGAGPAAVLHPSSPDPSGCETLPVAVLDRSWTAVKGLFR